jgi:FkbH-like protein
MGQIAKRRIKCMVWDLDNTIWSGVLLEDPEVSLRPGIVETLTVLDQRGILCSIASHNLSEPALEKLRHFGIEHFFLYPQFGWEPKSDSVRRIASRLNIGLDTIAFVDDDPFHLEEVALALPEVRCFDAADLTRLVDEERLQVDRVTPESRGRREMLRAEMERERAEEIFSGSRESFLASLDLRIHIGAAGEEDLQRAEELTLRTNQLNSTGRTYSLEELQALRRSKDHRLLIASLTDRFGSYGKIGLVLLELAPDRWRIRLLLVSCRVISRGAGAALLTYLIRAAREAGVRLQADFVPNSRNRQMHIAYRFAGFEAVAQEEGITLLERDLSTCPPFPEYLHVFID